jgi:hypothetical protein
VAGALIAAHMTVSMSGAFVVPLFTTSIVPSVGFGGVTEILCLILVIAYTPLHFCWLIQYTRTSRPEAS